MRDRESLCSYLARGGRVERGPYVPCFGDGNARPGRFKHYGTASGLKAQIDRGCPSCGGPVRCVRGSLSPSIIECERCGESFRAATGEAV